MQKTNNIGGYDDNSFVDNKGVRFLADYLEEKHNIKTHFKTDEKYPNLDGSFELCERNNNIAIPIAPFDVQIKTTESKYINHNKKINRTKYKFSFDTKAFNIVKKGSVYNPVILFLVDIKNKKIFWWHITYDFIWKNEYK